MSGFERPLRIDTIGTSARDVEIEADPDERAGLARRFAIDALNLLTARASVGRRDDEIRASGRLQAALVQSCVATGAALSARLDVPFDVVFRDEPPADAPDAGIELSESDCDVVFYRGGAIDLGEVVAETLALAIDPYPRSPDADAVLKELGVLSEGEAGPFAVLAGLRKGPGRPL